MIKKDKRGRPKDISKSKNRIHSIVLNEKNEFIYREICKDSNLQWFSNFVNECLIKTFQNDNINKKYLIYRLNEVTKERNKLEEEINIISKKLKEKP